MKTLLIVAVISLAITLSCVSLQKAKSRGRLAGTADAPVEFSGPFIHDNLAIYLVHGKDVLGKHTFLTLQEALEQKKIVVHETQKVNTLAVENISDSDVIYLMAGDIVRGGKQDRVLGDDLLVSPKTGKVPIESFCVEHGRWSRRGQETAGRFGSSTNAACSISLKQAIRQKRDQSLVWSKVSSQQAALSENVDADVKSADSPSSLELTMDNESVKKAAGEYSGKLDRIAREESDALGYVAIINGKINCSDVYGSHELFVKLWPKLLDACAIEALAEKKKAGKLTVPDRAAVAAFLADVQRGRSGEEKVSDRVSCISRETDGSVLYETVDRENGGWIRRNYLNKKYEESSQPERPRNYRQSGD